MPRTISTPLLTEFGRFDVSYHDNEKWPCVLLKLGDVNVGAPLVRLHSSCVFSEAFGSIDCDCSLQLVTSMEMIQAEGAGVIAYLYQEGRGHGLEAKIRAMRMESDHNCDTVDAFQLLKLDLDPRSYTPAVEALQAHNVSRTIRLMTNNPRKADFLEKHGFEIVEVVPLKYNVSEHIREYLVTKRNKLGHTINEEVLNGCLSNNSTKD